MTVQRLKGPENSIAWSTGRRSCPTAKGSWLSPLQRGDEIEIAVTGIGTLRNVVEET